MSAVASATRVGCKRVWQGHLRPSAGRWCSCRLLQTRTSCHVCDSKHKRANCAFARGHRFASDHRDSYCLVFASCANMSRRLGPASICLETRHSASRDRRRHRQVSPMAPLELNNPDRYVPLRYDYMCVCMRVRGRYNLRAEAKPEVSGFAAKANRLCKYASVASQPSSRAWRIISDRARPNQCRS